jgi:hypothetical protein
MSATGSHDASNANGAAYARVPELRIQAPSNADAFEVLCLQAADNGRGKVLFGDSLGRARSLARPFMAAMEFPSVYLEFPLAGKPFLDVTVLYSNGGPGHPIESEAAAGTEEVIAWFAKECAQHANVSFGFELDTSKQQLPAVAIHFQPRTHKELVQPFCEHVGEPERAALYLELADRMPQDWPLSFFGMFRGRPNSPLRACGYLSLNEADECASDPRRLPAVFKAVGFSAFDNTMLEQIRTLMSVTSNALDFQFDVLSDGSIGDTFAIDVQFHIEQPDAVQASFSTGELAPLMRLLEGWGIADARWKLGVESAFARAIRVVPRGESDRYSFTLMPQWAKVRWKNGVLQPAKLYLLGKAGFNG